MNNIYKVIWSKAKNCYVVASEIARSHTKSATGSEKIGGVTRRSLLASLMALSLLCGGLGVASAADSVKVDVSTTSTTEVYTTTGVNTLLDGKADKTALDNKADKATTLAGYGIADAYSKGEVDNALNNKADKATTLAGYGIADAYSKGEVDNALNNKADKATTLAGYGIADAYTKGEVDNALNNKADKATTLAGYGITDAYTKGDVDTRLNEKADKTALIQATDRITANETTIAGLTTKTTKITYDAALGTNVDGVTFNAGAVTGVTSINGTEIGTKESGTYIHQDSSIWGNMKKVDTQVKTNADNIQTNANNIKINKDEIARVNGELVKTNDHFNTELGKTNAALQATNKRTAGIGRTDTGVEAGNQTVIEGKVYFDQNGNVSGVKDLQTDTIHATGEITSEGLDAGSGEITTKGKVSAGDVSTGTLETTGKATIGGNLDVKGTLNIKDVTAETIHISKSEDNADYKSEGSIIGDGGKLSVSNEKTDKRTNITEKSELNVNEKGTVNWATSTDNATGNVTEGRSEVTADNIKNSVKKTEGGKTFGYEENITADGKVGTVTDKEGNTSTTRQDSKGVYGYAKDKDGNKSYTKQEGNRIAESVIGQDGKETKSEMTSTDITNTAKDGTITNDAKDIVNNATGDMTNNVGGNLSTTVGGNEIHEVKGTKTETVEGKLTENFKGGQETNVTGDQTTNVSGTQTTTATDINRNASSGMIDTIDNDYGTNTETKVAGKTTTDVSIKGTGEKGQYIRGANESRDYLIKGTLKNSETKTAEATSTEITDGTNKASTIQDAKNLAGSVTNGTETGVSGIHANNDGSVSIDSSVAGGGMSSVINQKKDSIQSAVGDGTNSTVIHQDKDNVTIASSNGMVGLVGKDIVNNAQDTITNTAGTKITDTAGDSTVTTENGKGTTFTKRGSMAYRDGGPTDTNISGNTITTGKVTMDYADVMRDLGVGGNANIAGTTTTKTLNVTEDASVGRDLSVGGNATIAGDVTARSYKVDGKTYIDANGINANNQKITNVADGSISEGSKDAVNGGQLYGVKRDLEHQVDKVGANAAAMANLRPMEFDPSSKWNIAAAIGNYGSETAAALGAFYRPNDNVMVNLSTAFGTGENMVGGGVSVRLGKGGNKLSREETNALKAQVADLSARMDALLSVLNPNMSKDFPDVPENHWAYEAVSRLAGNDIVQGYPDGEFHGERTMTRYEMAEIIYNALSRGAEAEKKLVEEFKPELQAMAASEKATAEKAEG